MGVKEVLQRHYRSTVNSAAKAMQNVPDTPSEGWIATVRKALRMSGRTLAKRLGVTPGRVPRMEQAERDGSITLRSLDAAARALNCRLVYAVVPEGEVEVLIREQARRAAAFLVDGSLVHMDLEAQSLTDKQRESLIEDLADKLVREQPGKIWVAPL